jgi:hypothetical protein
MLRKDKKVDTLVGDGATSDVSGPNKRRISRRSFLAGTIATAALFVGADKGLSEIIWGDQQTDVRVLPEHEKLDSDELWLVVPGLGVQSSFGIASTLRTSLEAQAPVAYLQISDEGLSLDALAEGVNRLCHDRKIKKLHLFGNSMGLPTGLQIANRTDISDIGYVVGDGSPHDMEDVKDEKLSRVVKKIVEVYPPGYLSKLIGEAVNSTIRDPNNELSILEQLKNAHRVTGEGVAPQVWADQLVLLGQVDPKTYTEKVQEKTKKAYIQPIEPDNDKVVKVTQANRKYSDTFGGITTLGIDISHHASPNEFSGQYNQAITNYLYRQTQKRRNPRLY